MLTRTVFLFFCLFAGMFSLVYVVGLKTYFSKPRMRRIGKIVLMIMAALLLAMAAFAFIINIDKIF